MRLLVYLGGILGLTGISIFLLGFCLPNEFKGEISKQFSCKPDKIWEYITSPELLNNAKEEFLAIRKLSENVWEEEDKLGAITRYEVVEAVENEKLVLKVINTAVGIEKTRVYLISANTQSSVLTVKQSCFVDKPLLKTTMAISGSKQDIRREMNVLYDQIHS